MPTDRQDNQKETDRGHPRSVSPYKAGFTCTCPHCGDGPLYSGILDVKETCDICGFDLRAADAGDGAQVFVIFVLGALSTLLGIFLYTLGLPKWAVMLVLIAFITGGTIWMLRIFKATLIALQFHHDAREGTLQEDYDDS